MVAFNRLLTAAFAFAATATALPYGNTTLDARAASDPICGADYPPIAGLPSADEDRIKSASTQAAPTDRVISIYWHVIHRDQTYAGGYLLQSQVNTAVDVLNSQYSGTGISFRLAGGRYIPNPDWFNNVDMTDQGENPSSLQMKRQLHLGSAKDLNIYSVGNMRSGLLGYATFPWWYNDAPQLDGVVFNWNTIPGGTMPPYSQGKILVHEVGHWVGLYHTFQGGCSGVGDEVADTPAEASPARDCFAGRDTCPGAGQDPIRNHMDYTDDNCRIEFTPGQVARMIGAVSLHRSQ